MAAEELISRGRNGEVAGDLCHFKIEKPFDLHAGGNAAKLNKI